MSEKRIGLLTGGGDAPGLNGIIESVVLTLSKAGYSIIGIQDGFEGVFERKTIPITVDKIHGIHAEAGTLLGTSNRCGIKGREKEFLENYLELNLQGLIAAGGDGTFAGLQSVSDKIKILGVPKTIDNDLAGTDLTFGFDTACSVVANAVDALRSTANAHRRVMVVETMGRTAGWIALGGGVASYADVILIPERKFNYQKLKDYILEKKKTQRGLIVVVAEGAQAINEETTVAFRVKDSPVAERYGGIAQKLAAWIEKETQWEARHVVLGHLQRAQHPTTTDRFLTAAMGVEVANLAIANRWGEAVVYRNGVVTHAPLSDLMKPARLVDSQHRWVKLAQALGLFI